MLLQPGYGMGLLNAYNTPYQPINPQMDHYNGLLGRISGMSFPTNQFDPTMVNQGIGNYWNGNTLMSGATGGPVSNLPQGAGAMYGTTQSYMDQLGRMPNQASEIVSPYIYHRPGTDPAALASASDLIQNPPPEEVVQNVSGWGNSGGGGDHGPDGAALAREAMVSRDVAEHNAGSAAAASAASAGMGASMGMGEGGGNYCFDPNTLVQMADGSEKKIKEMQIGDKTLGGKVTGVLQFKPTDEIYNYKDVIVAGSHFVKEDDEFIPVADSPHSFKIDIIPVVYSLDTSDRRIWIKGIEFADYNGDGIAKNFLRNSGIDLSGFNQEVLRQVEHKLM